MNSVGFQAQIGLMDAGLLNTLQVDPYGNIRLGFEGKTTINRKDWGVNWNAALEAGGVLVSEKVTLEFEVSAIRNVAS